MPNKKETINLSNSDEFRKIVGILRKTITNKTDEDSHFHEEFNEAELRATFKGLSIDEKLLMLYEVVINNAVLISDSERRLDHFRKAEKISTTTWFRKVLISFLAFVGCVTFSTFAFMMVKNGALNDISFIASFLKTINEVLNVIFLTK